MTKVFLISDTHFFHANILTFIGQNDELMRPNFKDVSHMNEHMVTRWNEIVKPEDKVYHLGDVSMRHTAENFKILGRLNGNKTLILGNHDSKKVGLYSPYFKSIYSSRGIGGFLLTHIPVHPFSLGKSIGNIHGHVHSNVPQGYFGPRYYNVSIEMLDDYRPILFDEVAEKIRSAISQNEKLQKREDEPFILHPRC